MDMAKHQVYANKGRREGQTHKSQARQQEHKCSSRVFVYVPIKTIQGYTFFFLPYFQQTEKTCNGCNNQAAAVQDDFYKLIFIIQESYGQNNIKLAGNYQCPGSKGAFPYRERTQHEQHANERKQEV